MEDKYELDETRLNFLTQTFNRSKNQTLFLYNLLEGDFDKLLVLEYKIKRNFINYCPINNLQVNNILNLSK